MSKIKIKTLKKEEGGKKKQKKKNKNVIKVKKWC